MHIFCLRCIMKILEDKSIGECFVCKTQFTLKEVKYSEVTDYYVKKFFPQIPKLIEDNKAQLLAAAKRGCTGFNISHPGDYVCILYHQSKIVAEYITSKYKLNISVTQGGINGYGNSVTLSWAEEPDVKNCDFNALR